MSDWQLNTPVAMLIFNRPETTARVFARVREVKPPVLLVVADGPRATRPDEAERCAATRSVVARVDWNCRVMTNYSEVNLGCKRRVSSGLDWVFNTVEEAIVLEDDCLPHPSFFRYCEELLARYREDTRIMAVSGDNFQLERRHSTYSYYFSRYNHVWGWASWRRAWQHYDVNMRLWPEVRDGGWLKGVLQDSRRVAYWTEIFDLVYSGKIDTWDYQWTFANWIQNGLAVLPSVNLVSNIGFGQSATHTSGTSVFADLPVKEMRFPLNPPPFVMRDHAADRHTDHLMFSPSFISRAKLKLKRAFA